MTGKLRLVTTLAAFSAFVLTLALAIPAEAKHAKQGYIYGKVTTRSGNSYTGLMRWDDEETFWDDLFHSYKENLPYSDYLEGHSRSSKKDVREVERELKRVEREEEALKKQYERIADRLAKAKSDEQRNELREEQLELIEDRTDMAEDRAQLFEELARLRERDSNRTVSVLGGALKINWNDWSTGGRIFIARFGDIKKITVIGSEDAELEMRNGSVYTVSGYSNDVGGTVKVKDAALGNISLEWRKIDTIEFMETPKNVEPDGYRMYGTLYTDSGEFTGFIQWDSEECISTDKIDGDSQDGRLSIDMGQIQTIERRSRSSSKIILQDGRTLYMEGTNDVDGSIRGIMVETKGHGRVKVPWDAFDRVEFSNDTGESGMGYDEYARQWQLNGSVVDAAGVERKGRIVFDLDESESWEILNGDQFDIEFDVPFSLIKSIQPRSRNFSIVELSNGESVRLEASQDVSSDNDGVLVFDKGEKDPTYIPWDEIELIKFSR
ncbi:hypothetical protein KQI63_11695 [bacterium]|nr:hypothetical protein [bacterium]